MSGCREVRATVNAVQVVPPFTLYSVLLIPLVSVGAVVVLTVTGPFVYEVLPPSVSVIVSPIPVTPEACRPRSSSRFVVPLGHVPRCQSHARYVRLLSVRVVVSRLHRESRPGDPLCYTPGSLSRSVRGRSRRAHRNGPFVYECSPSVSVMSARPVTTASVVHSWSRSCTGFRCRVTRRVGPRMDTVRLLDVRARQSSPDRKRGPGRPSTL
jgi:hypothetical protein